MITEDEFTYKSQDVNYLGFLEAQLRDQQGIATLAFELIQNADDVQESDELSAATILTFDITDTALIVENDGVFRPVDFARLQNIAGGGKRDEIGTTGAFGLGFIAVYQVTDAPEIYSNNRHWVIRPDAPPDKRILERRTTTCGTRFYLPWAFDESSLVRRTLRGEAIQLNQLDVFVEQIGEALALAALFLNQLQVLEVKRNGRLIQRIRRTIINDEQITLTNDDGQDTTWLLINGDFAAAAAQLRERYPWQIEAKRRNQVRLAIPAAGLIGPGRLFAVLPTQSTTPLPLHINADFFPTTDRKRIHFGNGYQAEWNRAAIYCAARLIAQQLDSLPDQLGPNDFWQLLQKTAVAKQLAEQNDLPHVFAQFWDAITPYLKDKPILYTAQGTWKKAAEVRILGNEGSVTAVTLLTALHIPVVHPDLAPYFSLMRRPEIDVGLLTIPDITQALKQLGLTRSTPLHAATPFLRSLEAWQTLWALIDELLTRQQDNTALQQCALVLTERMTVVPLNQVYQGTAEAKALFPEVDWLHKLVPENIFPGRFVTQFGVREAVDMLVEMPLEQLEDMWRFGGLDLPRLLRWFESQQIEIFADDPALQKEIRRLPLCPVGGELRPLDHLYISGGFADPLRLAGVVDLEAIGGRRQFLQDLGVQELDFETYLYELMPRTLAQNPDVPSDARQRLVQLLADRLGEFRDDPDLQAQLSQLPLIACMDGSFRAANTVYATREAMTLLGEQIHIAEPVSRRAVGALHRWLGVREQATAVDIVKALLTISRQWAANDQPLDALTHDRVWGCLRRLDTLLIEEQITPQMLAPLLKHKIIPNRQRRLRWPDQLFVADDAELTALFTGLADYFLTPDAASAQVTAVLGVRSLSSAVQLQLGQPFAAERDVVIEERIRSRIPHLMRVLQAESMSEAPQFLHTVQVMKVAHLAVQYRLVIDRETHLTALKAVTVTYIGQTNSLYVTYETDLYPWAAIARELALTVKKTGSIGGLALGIKEVLMAETAVAAAQTLDELGYPLREG